MPAAVLTGVLLLAGVSAAQDSSGVTDRVSLASGGAQGNAESLAPALSSGGRYVAFVSAASNLTGGDTNGSQDIFVRDRQSGLTTRVSRDSSGVQANADSSSPTISGNGRFVGFDSAASNLVAGDTNGVSDVFVHDRQSGVTTRVSAEAGGAQSDGHSTGPSISGSGRFVAFDSFASNLVAGDTNDFRDVFVHDRKTGATIRASRATDGAEADSSNIEASISADGHFVAFRSSASNLVADDTNYLHDIFVHDLATGATSRENIGVDGAQADLGSASPSLSANGRFVAFSSYASNLAPVDLNGRRDIFVRDRATGITTRESVATGGTESSDDSYSPSISADGRLVAFDSEADDLAGDKANDASDIFLRDRALLTTTRLSVGLGGSPANSHSFAASLNSDGCSIAFQSLASNLTQGDTNAVADVFAHETILTSLSPSPAPTPTPAPQAEMTAAAAASGPSVQARIELGAGTEPQVSATACSSALT